MFLTWLSDKEITRWIAFYLCVWIKGLIITNRETEPSSTGFAFEDDLAIKYTCKVNRIAYDQIFFTFLMLVCKKNPFIMQKTLILDFYFSYKKSVNYFDVANAFFSKRNDFLIRWFFLSCKNEIQSYQYKWNT